MSISSLLALALGGIETQATGANLTFRWREQPTEQLAKYLSVASDSRWKRLRAERRLRRAKDRANVRTWPDGRHK